MVVYPNAHLASGLPGGSHVSVCVCTYKRPDELDRLLKNLTVQETDGLFRYSVVVVDNDSCESAKHIVQSHASRGLPVKYFIEPDQNIALARNKAVANAEGNFIAFIDDDEFPDSGWLLTLYNAIKQYSAAGILGPVLPHFEGRPPGWIMRGKFYERPTHLTGTVLEWSSTRTGNALLDARILNGDTIPFEPQLGSGGEDRAFFRKMMKRGHTFVWCNEAPVHEVVPPHRWKKSFMLKRALLRGQHYKTSASYTRMTIPLSIMAIPIYVVALPFLRLAGEHVFMKYLIKVCDHIGKCVAFVGATVVNERYITE